MRYFRPKYILAIGNDFVRTMKPAITLLLATLCCVHNVFPQSIARSTLGSGGSSQTVIVNTKSYFLSQSIGQASVIGTSTVNGYTLRQGFQQPPHSFIVGQLQEESDLKATIYPNPFQQSLNISFKDEIEKDVSVIMHDISGRILIRDRFKPSQLITLRLATLAPGEYILSVTSGSKYLRASLIKQ